MKRMIIAACTVLVLGFGWVVSAPTAHADDATYYGSPSNVADGGNG